MTRDAAQAIALSLVALVAVILFLANNQPFTSPPPAVHPLHPATAPAR